MRVFEKIQYVFFRISKPPDIDVIICNVSIGKVTVPEVEKSEWHGIIDKSLKRPFGGSLWRWFQLLQCGSLSISKSRLEKT